MQPEPASPLVRLDRWLCAARVFKSRTLAAAACGAGHVSVNGRAVRASHAGKVGDEVRAKPPRGPVVLIVIRLADKRLSPKDAVLLYEDRSPPPPPDDPVFRRERGSGRPTKADRRKLDKMRRW
ncbi:MAG TPA: S4 domain-containing protein [Polyangiaceae bacterium]